MACRKKAARLAEFPRVERAVLTADRLPRTDHQREPFGDYLCGINLVSPGSVNTSRPSSSGDRSAGVSGIMAGA